MHEVYLGRFHAGAGGLPLADDEEVICGIGPLTVPTADYVAAGAGWNRYPELLAQNNHLISATAEVIYPRARYLLQLGDSAKKAGGAMPPGWSRRARRTAFSRAYNDHHAATPRHAAQLLGKTRREARDAVFVLWVAAASAQDGPRTAQLSLLGEQP